MNVAKADPMLGPPHSKIMKPVRPGGKGVRRRRVESVGSVTRTDAEMELRDPQPAISEAISDLVNEDTATQLRDPRPNAADKSVITISGVARGDRLEHYVVLGKLGEGGMGVVLEGYDARLDRKVAIKVLQPKILALTDARRAQARLLREAKAVAKLSHPNVIKVHSVGTVGDQVFVAMEFMKGGTAGQWLRKEKRSRKEILDLFMQVGRGLAAAHEGGLVHRDFKPENILIGKHNHAVVTDFGLVSTAGEIVVDEPFATPSGANVGLTQIMLTSTKTGAIRGTPAYMAPEQFRGARLDARADQFAFAVSLYEALYGERPFAGTQFRDLARSVCTGDVRPAPRQSDVPNWIRLVLLRALSVDPNDRFESMGELLTALAHDPNRRKGRVFGSVLALAAIGTVAAFIGFGKPEAPTPVGVCTGDEEVREVWGPAHRAKTQAAFAKPDDFKRFASVLDAYAAEWATMRTSSCEATRVHKTQPQILYELRLGCLNARRAALQDVVTAAANRGSEALEKLTALPPIADCDQDSSRMVGAVFAKPTEPVSPPPLPAPVTFVVTSEPSGAAVLRADGVKVGTTPYTGEYERADGVLELIVLKTGYQPTKARFSTTEDGTEHVSLVKVAKPRTSRRATRRSRRITPSAPPASPPAATKPVSRAKLGKHVRLKPGG